MHSHYFFVYINNGDLMNIVLLCIEIFFARIIDVSLGTIRTVIVVKGKNLIGSILGFFEVTVWFLVVEQALTTSNNNIFIVFSYAIGFATGTYIGGILSGRLVKSKYEVQIITDKNVQKMIDLIRESSMAVSILKLEGKNKNKYMLFVEVDNNKIKELSSIVKSVDNKAFMVVNETMFVHNGIMGILVLINSVLI